MDRYTRVTRIEEWDRQAVPTPRVRIERALKETQRPEHHKAGCPEPSMRDLRTSPMQARWFRQQPGLELPYDGGSPRDIVPPAVPAPGSPPGAQGEDIYL